MLDTMNNHITVFSYGPSANKFDSHVFKYSKKMKMLPRNLIIKYIPLCQLAMKINCYVMNLTYIKCNFIQ